MARAGRLAAVAAGYATAVAALGWASAGLWRQLHQPGPAPFEILLAACAGAGAWFAVAWLTAGFVVAALATLPGKAGRLCAEAAAWIAPSATRRLACVVFGGAIISGTGLASAMPAGAAATGAGPPPAVPAATAVRLPDLDRPEHGLRLAARRRGMPAQPIAQASKPHRPTGEVVVRRGDTLWGLAARHLPPDSSAAAIAAEWPRWFEANRRVIGADPDLIRPGQRLRPPTHVPEEQR
jgi:resuscitation-promoting factor RpfA